MRPASYVVPFGDGGGGGGGGDCDGGVAVAAAGNGVRERLGILERHSCALACLRCHGVCGVANEHDARQWQRPAWEWRGFEESITGRGILVWGRGEKSSSLDLFPFFTLKY